MSEERRFVHFSQDRKYRYCLSIIWDGELPMLVVIGLNPSRADEKDDDPTVRRWKGYAKAWGYGGIMVLNLFALVATDQSELRKVADPVGPFNMVSYLEANMKNLDAPWALACWGGEVWDMVRVRATAVRAMVRLRCLKKNADGSPSHPLYLKKGLTAVPYNYQEAKA